MKNMIIMLKKAKQFQLQSRGQSMVPILYPDDIIYYRNLPFSRYKTDDLILFYKENQLFTHRVIYKTHKYLITKGDNNLKSDGTIFPNQIIAKVYQVERNGISFDPESIYFDQSKNYFQEIIKLNEVFHKEKIDFVYLKGLPIHLYYEKMYPKRLYLDCDILVRLKHFNRVKEILTNYGYKQSITQLSSIHQKIKDKETENIFYKAINNFVVMFDLHVEVVFLMTQLGKLESLYPQKLVNQLTYECLSSKKIVTIQNSDFPILSAHFQILYLALHFFHHNFCGAFRLEFLDRIIRQQEINWENEANIIKKYRLQNFVYPVFVLLKKYYQTPMAQSFLLSIQQINRKAVKSIFKINIFNDESRLNVGIKRFKNLFFLSPNPLWRRLTVFINLQVIYSILWVAKRKLFILSQYD